MVDETYDLVRYDLAWRTPIGHWPIQGKDAQLVLRSERWHPVLHVRWT